VALNIFRMDELHFDQCLFDDSFSKMINPISEIGFMVDRIVKTPLYKPFRLEYITNLSRFLCQDPSFRQKLLEKSACECFVLLYRLFLFGVFSFNEIEPFFENEESFLLCFYFKKQIKDFEEFICCKSVPYGLEIPYLSDELLELYIEYGFDPLSINFYLKYDEIDKLKEFLGTLKSIESININWSPFEWSQRPSSFDLLSFSGHFGSIRCFKFLLMNGIRITDIVCQNVIYGGSFELFHLSFSEKYNMHELVSMACVSNNIIMLEYLLDNYVDINGQTKYVLDLFF